MAKPVCFEVQVDELHAAGQVFKAGVHEVDVADDPELARHLAAAGAANAGVVILEEGTHSGFAKIQAEHVEPDEASLAYQAKVEAIRHRLMPERDADLYACQQLQVEGEPASPEQIEEARQAVLDRFEVLVEAEVAKEVRR